MEPLRPFGDIDSSGVGAEKKGVESAKKDGEQQNGSATRTTELAEAETSDEKRAAYEDRRNGLGPRLVPALKAQKHRQIATVRWIDSLLIYLHTNLYYDSRPRSLNHTLPTNSHFHLHTTSSTTKTTNRSPQAAPTIPTHPHRPSTQGWTRA